MRMPPASFLALSFLLSATAAHAESTAAAAPAPGIEFSGSGFLTLGVGRMLGGSRGNVADNDCPCFIADYAQAGVYDGRSGLQWKPDSKLGLQGTASITGTNFSMTAQAVARGARDGRVNIEWLYASQALDEKTTLQIGRKRLPMFYYSDTQDIGFAMPWTHLPPQLYGWEAVNYNGVNLLHQDHWGGWAATLNVLAGSETKKESGYWKIYKGRQNRTDIRWNSILGGDLTLSNGGFETRLVYIQSRTRTRNVTGSWDPAMQSYDSTTANAAFTPATRQRIHGIAFNVDRDDWLIRTEFIHIDRPGENWKDFSQIVGVGRRFGLWQLMATWSGFHANANLSAGGNPDGQEAHENRSITLRYDLTSTSALKAQLDSQKDRGGPNWAPRYGDSRLLTFAYDSVF
ncbi:MAG: hypothetical protein Q8O34_05580 [Rhodocyclaceae bacterium]|nr:hypothetical protein [Rhodocyclaceae bacterium]